MVAVTCQEWLVRGGEVLLLQNMLYCQAARRGSGLCIVTGLNGWEASFVCAQQEDLGSAGKWYFCSSFVRIFRLKNQGQHRLLPAAEDTADIPEGGGPGHPTSRPCSPSGGRTPGSLWQPAHPFFFCSLREVSGQWQKFLLEKGLLGYMQKKKSAFWLLFIQKYLSMSLGFSVKGKQTPTAPLASLHLGTLMLYKTKTKT